MNRGSLLAALGVGAGLAYLFDPDRGRSRRARLFDRLGRGSRRTRRALATTGRDIGNRMSGTAAELSSGLQDDEPDDDVLVARVRSTLGHIVSHAHVLKVSATDGAVTLSGPMLAAEVPGLIDAVRRVRGVRDVVYDLDEHGEAGNVPALQGGHAHPHSSAHPSPTSRVMTGAGGATLAAVGARRHDVTGWLMTAGGLALLAKAARKPQ